MESFVGQLARSRCETCQPPTAIKTNSTVQTGPNIQPAGLKTGLISCAYHSPGRRQVADGKTATKHQYEEQGQRKSGGSWLMVPFMKDEILAS